MTSGQFACFEGLSTQPFSFFSNYICAMDFLPALKAIAQWVVLGLNFVFILGVIRQKIWAWPIGIIASAISVWLFIDVKLFSEALLYSVYIVLGFYGWFRWMPGKNTKSRAISEASPKVHLFAILIGLITWIGLGSFFQYFTDSALPYADAFSTAFAFVATYLESEKYLRHWWYWIVLNAFSIWLYHARELDIMAFMLLGFTAFSVVGYYSWVKQVNPTTAED